MFLNFFLLFRLRDEKIFLQMKQQEERQKKALERSQAEIKKTVKKNFIILIYPWHKIILQLFVTIKGVIFIFSQKKKKFIKFVTPTSFSPS